MTYFVKVSHGLAKPPVEFSGGLALPQFTSN